MAGKAGLDFKYKKLCIRVASRVAERLNPANISTLFQLCLLVDTTLRRGTTSNQR